MRLSPSNFLTQQAQCGFTLVECMACVSIAAILSAVSLPSMSGWVERTAVQAEVDQFETVVHQARVEAVVRGEVVTLCALDPLADTAKPSCAETGKDWTAGWVLFVDRGNRGAVDESDAVLLVHQTSARVGWVDATLRYITFSPLGVSNSAASRFQFRPRSADPAESNPVNSRLVCVNKPGRTRVLKQALCT